jgi:aminoglycoside N3'-acetyltransferase
MIDRRGRLLLVALNLSRFLRVHNIRRAINRHVNRAVYSVDKPTLKSAFSRIGIGKGMTVVVHSQLSRLGHIAGGPAMVVETLMEAVTEDGCIVMPTYPSRGSMAAYLDAGFVFDVRNTPSAVGALTETFRTWPGVKRSHHPTNPVAAWGKHAEALLHGHELSLTPYGDETPYGRLARMDDSYNLMMETPVLSLLHHLQERVNFPNYTLDGVREASFIDSSGAHRTVTTTVMRPGLPYYIAIPPQAHGHHDWALLHDFALMFPASREREVRRLYRLMGYPPIWQRRAQLTKAQCLQATRLGKGEIGIVRIKQFLQILIPELDELIERFRPCYELSRLATEELPRYTTGVPSKLAAREALRKADGERPLTTRACVPPHSRR